MATSYLTASQPHQPRDADLEDIFQRAIVGITGIAGDLVRPAWQPSVPNQPEFNVDWIAFRVVAADDYQDPHIKQLPDPDGDAAELTKDEFYEVTCSFYGPNGSQVMSLLRDGILLGQNRAALKEVGINLVSTFAPVNLPALLKEQWVRRIDLRMKFSRRVRRVYGLGSIQSAGVQLETDTQTHRVTPIQVNPPA